MAEVISSTYSGLISTLLLLHRTLSTHFRRAGEATACSRASGGWDSATGGGAALWASTGGEGARRESREQSSARRKEFRHNEEC